MPIYVSEEERLRLQSLAEQDLANFGPQPSAEPSFSPPSFSSEPPAWSVQAPSAPDFSGQNMEQSNPWTDQPPPPTFEPPAWSTGPQQPDYNLNFNWNFPPPDGRAQRAAYLQGDVTGDQPFDPNAFI